MKDKSANFKVGDQVSPKDTSQWITENERTIFLLKQSQVLTITLISPRGYLVFAGLDLTTLKRNPAFNPIYFRRIHTLIKGELLEYNFIGNVRVPKYIFDNPTK